ncbi:MAG: hypothetical protein M3Q43_06830 [Actinomycetota bacterium]|jgi:hypothetical protein|nr:hypothetical protein [Actinomycetota bacterium]
MSIKLPMIGAALTALALGASACGGSGGGGGGGQPPAQQPAQEPQAQAPTPVAEVSNLSGESTAVTLDEKFTGALEELKVTPGPVGDAKISEAGVAKFPITAGNVTYFEPGSVSPSVQGEIMHEGSGLSLEAGDTKVEIEDFVVNPGNSKLTATVSANGEVAAEDAEVFFLDGTNLKPLQTKGNQAILKGTDVTLTEDAAELLNTTFEVDAFEKGLPIGEAKITLDTQ